MRIDGNKIRNLLNLIREEKNNDLGHLSTGLEVEDKNGTKYTIVKIKRDISSGDDEKGDISMLILKYYDINGNKKHAKVSKEDFLKLFKIDKKKNSKDKKDKK